MPTFKGILEALFWMVMACFCAFFAMVLISWGGLPVLGYIGVVGVLLIIPLILRIVSISRRRRAGALVTYLEQAVRLNLPLPRMIYAAQQSESGYLSDRLAALGRQLESGETLSTSLRLAAPEVSAASRAMIEAGERIGRLPHALRRLMRQLSRRSNDESTDSLYLRAYPFLMTVMMATTVSLFAVFVMPKYQSIFHDFGIELPYVTTATVDFAQSAGLVALLVVTVLMFVWSGYSLWQIVHPRARDWDVLQSARDRIYWWLPLMRGMERDRGLADALDLVAESLRAGQPIDRAVAAASELHVNAVLRERLDHWAKFLAAGIDVPAAARRARLPDLLVEMLATADRRDQAADVCDFLARYHDSRFSRTRVLIRAVAVPLMVFFFASFVALIAISVFTPMTKLIEVLSSPPHRAWL